MALETSKEERASFADSIKVEKLDSHTYRINLNERFCIGAVPNGGYTASCILAAASTHLSPRGQPDTLTAHLEYASRTSVGPAIIIVDEVKLGRQLSTVHLTLWQGGLLAAAPWITPSVSRRTVLAYATHTRLQAMTGMTITTGFETTPAAALPPVPLDFAALLANGSDDTWRKPRLPTTSVFSRALRNWHFFLPRAGTLAPGVLDVWMRTENGERITQGMLPYVVDSFPYNLHWYLGAPEAVARLQAAREEEEEETTGRGGDSPKKDVRASLWFPTVVLNLEVKAALPEEGVEWLAMRVTSKQIKDGRFDLDVSVRDVDGKLLALSHQVALVLSLERNLKKSLGSAAL